MERLPYRFPEFFSGDWDLFKKVFSNPETVVFFDADGILLDTPKVVLKTFTKETGIYANPAKYNSWSYLTNLATEAGFPEDKLQHVEDVWYKPEVLSEARRYLYMRPVVRKTTGFFGSERNFVLTAREPYLDQVTKESIARNYPEIPQSNLLIRKDPTINPGTFKVDQIRANATKSPWVVLIEDSQIFVKAALDGAIDNLLVVNIPLGLVTPEFRHERLIVIKRFPDEIQAMYPLMDAVFRATDGMSHNLDSSLTLS